MAKRSESLEFFIGHYRRFFASILTVVLNYTHAEEVFQEAAGVLPSRFALYEAGSHFFPRARQVAKNRVLEYYKRKRLVFPIDCETLGRMQAVDEPI